MPSITEYVVKLQELTQQNLNILKSINDSFLTKKDHLAVRIGDSQYSMPSFINLENKINSLISNFENLVHAPETGEAFFNFDGNSRSIQVRSYTTTPNSLQLQPVQNFSTENNYIFKDFLTPKPYINFDVKSLPNDIVQVIVKKIIPIHEDLVQLFKAELNTKTSIQYLYKDLYKTLTLYKKDEDYIEYDSIIDLPIRKNIGSGIYVIEKIIEDRIDENLDNYITLKFRSDMESPLYMNSLSYRLFDETIQTSLKEGDKLTTYDGSAKLEIVELGKNSNTIVAKVLHGEYLNLSTAETNNENILNSSNQLRFYSPIDFDNDKIIKVALEEDQYIFISIAALNNRMNVQSSWGSGVLINTYLLTNNNESFETYYKNNVKNVGDILFEISTLTTNSLTKYSEAQYKEFVNLIPVINEKNLLVSRINKHLDNSSTIQNIKSLYSQKKYYQNQLSELQEEINNIQSILTSISFDDTTGIRSSYTAQLQDLSTKRNNLIDSISGILTNISTEANNSEIPIENAKYRIRGFFDYITFLKDIKREDLIDHIKGIHVQYRYKNSKQEQGNAMSINDNFIFSDWNNMNNFDRAFEPKYNNGYTFHIQENNDIKNEPSFNQIDIPISQGETVDIRLRLIYDFGYPFVQTCSQWSQIINVKFPQEYLKDVQILDIIEENNKDIEDNRFTKLIYNEGIFSHINDKIEDQNIVYYHNPEHIASGFYTEERRIIPLKDKLSSIDSMLIELRDEIFGTNMDSIKVSLKHGTSNVNLLPYQNQYIMMESYDSFSGEKSIQDGLYEKENGWVTTIINLSLCNNTNHMVKLFSLFPGDRNISLNNRNRSSKFNREEYCDSTKKDLGVWFEYQSDVPSQIIQGCNQFLYFRTKNVYTNEAYYVEGNPHDPNSDLSNTVLSLEKRFMKSDKNSNYAGAYMYPKLSNKYGLCLNSDESGSYLLLKPNEEIIIPICFEYQLNETERNISKTMSFDIWPSLYQDPITYTFSVQAKLELSSQDKVIMSNNKRNHKFNSIIK